MKRKNESEAKSEPAPKQIKKNNTSNKIKSAKPTSKKSFQNNNAEKQIKGKFEKSSGTKQLGKPSAFGKKNKSHSVNGNHQGNSNEKPNWGQIKEEKKELKGKRKLKKLNEVYDVTVKAKQICEKLRRTDCSTEEREKLCTELFKLLNGSFDKLVFSHDMSRVIQILLKYSDNKIRESIMTELKSLIVLMFQSKYAKNCIIKALKYGTDKIREEILSACNGHVVNLICHTIASPILDIAYRNWANEKTKNYFKQEFYGDMYKKSKDDKVHMLLDVFAIAKDMKAATLSAVKINLLKALNKNLIGSALIQNVMAEFLEVCSEEDRTQLIVMLRDSIVELSKSKDGAKVAMICIWHGTAKDRKFSLKALKNNVKDIATSEHGHLILMAMFDSIDDTVLMKKIFIPELLENVIDIVANEYGKKVILYLVAHREPQHFHPGVIVSMQEGDNNTSSKKPAEIRKKELLAAVIEPLLESITGETTFWLANSSIAMVTLAILKVGHGEALVKAFIAITEFITNMDSIVKEKTTEHKAIEHPGLHMMLKKLIIADKNLIENNQKAFGEILIEKLDATTIDQWIEYNRACFLLILLLENESKSALSNLTSILKSKITLLKCKKHKGASILMKKLNEI